MPDKKMYSRPIPPTELVVDGVIIKFGRDPVNMKCPKCKSDLVVEGESKYVKKLYWCDECDNEWVK